VPPIERPIDGVAVLVVGHDNAQVSPASRVGDLVNDGNVQLA